MKLIWLLPVVLVSTGVALMPAIAAPPLGTDSAQKPWKVEITLYDNPDAGRMYVADATLLADDALIVPITWWPRADVPRYEWYEEGASTAQSRADYTRERLRLLYVGITRARRDLIVTWNSGRQGDAQPSLAMEALRGWWETK